ncbi:MAG: peptidyl-prolyl cis-trans isomerase [Deltaproteobacteria bacterium]|nr:peptidyl-prolyl cis-trans isomerase [Deltaproteobacteria bacterium]MBW2446262.1 peptidyl-prolyl cis-trans isomerase [Deltaproteobacteria bacterium]
MALARTPLLHFVLLGSVIFALQPSETPALVFGPAEREQLQREFEQREARPPSPGEVDALVDAAVEEEILLRAAARAGHLRHDGTVVNRLVQLGHFLSPEGEASDEAALHRARELGLDRSDPVIRRYLVERMRLALASEADRPAPGEAELEAHLALHAERFAIPERVRLAHVFVGRRHADVEARLDAVGRSLSGLRPEDAAGLGDPFAGPRTRVAPREVLARDFGAEFVAALDPSRLASWQGPLPSAHGWHWVWLGAPLPARQPTLAEVRGQVQQDLFEIRRAQRLQARLEELRSGYSIRLN